MSVITPQRWPSKDPDEVLDYRVDWSARLDGDTITTSTFIAPDGITLGAQLHDDTKTTIWLSGGTLGQTYEIVNRIETAGGRVMDQTVTLQIRSK